MALHPPVSSQNNLCPLTQVGAFESGVFQPKFEWSLIYVKYALAKPWNRVVKPGLKAVYRQYLTLQQQVKLRQSDHTTEEGHYISGGLKKPALPDFQQGDLVRVKTRAQIEKTLDPFQELKGCAFLDSMYHYCGTVQCINTKVERFLDERNFRVRTANGLYLLDHLFCTGTPVFGRCDRRCYYFWRVEWLEPA